VRVTLELLRVAPVRAQERAPTVTVKGSDAGCAPHEAMETVKVRMPVVAEERDVRDIAEKEGVEAAE
jgi:hypothetical protein